MWAPLSPSTAPTVEPLKSPNKTTLAHSAVREALRLVMEGSSITLEVSRGVAWHACKMVDSEGVFQSKLHASMQVQSAP